MKNASTDSEIEKLYTFLEQVKDPEIPVLSILDLGIVRKVTLEDNHVQIDITPTVNKKYLTIGTIVFLVFALISFIGFLCRMLPTVL